jgi:glucose 1-dehydrogenase
MVASENRSGAYLKYELTTVLYPRTSFTEITTQVDPFRLSKFPRTIAMKRYEGRRAIVTGGAQGIGLACVRRLLDEGAQVLAADIQPWEITQALKSLSPNRDFQYCRADVSNRSEVDKMVKLAVETFGGVDVLVSNVGVARKIPFLDLTDQDLQSDFQVNLISMILCGQAVARQMKAQGKGGSIVHMSSVNAVMAMPGYTTYNVSKGGVEQLTRVMALELAPLGIRVNAVGPGTILSEMSRNAVLSDEEAKRTILSRTPMGRFGEPEDVASVVAFLASNDAGYITGETIFIDGGRRALNYTVPVASSGST